MISKSGARSWTFLFERNGRQREAGLGGVHSVSLARAREKAVEWRSARADGQDPLDLKKTANDARKTSAARQTFGRAAEAFIAANSPAWRNAKHRAQWRMTLETYAASLWQIPVDEVDAAAVLGALQPIWQIKPETASRVRGRIESVLDAARAQGQRTGDNPARWKGHLDKILPKPKKLVRGHHAAMDYHDVPAFFARLCERPAIAARALQFLILTASRPGEVLGAQWCEFDLAGKVWTVPATRMKGGRSQRVPLSCPALKICDALGETKLSDFLFFGQDLDRPLSNMALEMVLRRMKIEGATVHGFRSAFRDWAGDRTSFPRAVTEAALAHVAGDATERAYRRGDALEKRRELMEAWGAYCNGELA